MNYQGLRWNVHCAANVGLRKRLNLYKRGFKIYDLLVASKIGCKSYASTGQGTLVRGIRGLGPRAVLESV